MDRGFFLCTPMTSFLGNSVRMRNLIILMDLLSLREFLGSSSDGGDFLFLVL